MLNELYTLSKALDEFQIPAIEYHPEYDDLPKPTEKNPFFRIWVSEQGHITGIDKPDQSIIKHLKKFGNNQGTFPAFNIVPLRRLTFEGQRYNDNWLKSYETMDNSLSLIARKFMSAIGYTECSETNIIVQLINATFKLTEYGFRKALEEYVLVAIKKGQSELNVILEHSGNDNKTPKDDMGDNISVILDLTEWRNYGDCPIAHENTTSWINQSLISTLHQNISSHKTNASDAFGNKFSTDSSFKTMPRVKLNHIGNVSLRAMFDGQPCQERYESFNDDSYPIALSNRMSARAALQWIGKDENEFKTWVRADNEILFAYPSKLPNISANFASIFGGIDVEGRFTDYAEEFTKSFSGKLSNAQPDYIRVFSIRKMDTARRKIVFTRNMASDDFNKMAEEWKDGCNNIPVLGLTIPDKKYSEPFPLSMAKIINTVWKQDGTTLKNGVNRMYPYQGVEFMLNACRSSTVYYMSILVSNIWGLFIYAAKNPKKLSKNIEHIINSAAMLGLLLYKHGCYKEEYMKNTAFLTGQLLKSADELHAFYSKVVRNGDMPPSLAGASMLVVASDRPDKALSQMLVRMSPYLRWAKNYCYENVDEKGKKSSKAWWLLNTFETISDQLSTVFTESVRLNDFDKAQLFLGYLATLPSKTENDK